VSSAPPIENNNQIVNPNSTHEEVIDNKDNYSNTSEINGEIICIHCNKKKFFISEQIANIFYNPN
jgi:hypothetical protein